MAINHHDQPTTTIDRIEKRSNVVGGRACIRGHRIPVWGLVRMRQLGATDDQILGEYPQLIRADLESAWTYAANHTVEIERDIRENEEGEEGLVGVTPDAVLLGEGLRPGV